MNRVDGAEGRFPFEKDLDPGRRVAFRESGVLEESGQGGRFHGEELPKSSGIIERRFSFKKCDGRAKVNC